MSTLKTTVATSEVDDVAQPQAGEDSDVQHQPKISLGTTEDGGQFGFGQVAPPFIQRALPALQMRPRIAGKTRLILQRLEDAPEELDVLVEGAGGDPRVPQVRRVGFGVAAGDIVQMHQAGGFSPLLEATPHDLVSLNRARFGLRLPIGRGAPCLPALLDLQLAMLGLLKLTHNVLANPRLFGRGKGGDHAAKNQSGAGEILARDRTGLGASSSRCSGWNGNARFWSPRLSATNWWSASSALARDVSSVE